MIMKGKYDICFLIYHTRGNMSGIITDILMSVYQSLGYALIAAIFMMFYHMYVNEMASGFGHIDAWKRWLLKFRREKTFRQLLVLNTYTMMVLFRTLLNRNMWSNPLSDVLGGWNLFPLDPDTNTRVLNGECVENFLLLMPFAYLLLCCLVNHHLFQHKSQKELVLLCLKIVFFFSVGIECTQLLFRVGTFQFADIFYNTFGGVWGCFLFLIREKIIKKRNK